MADRDLDAVVGWFELDLQKLRDHSRRDFQYQPLPRFPVAWRDVAVVVDRSKMARELEITIRKAGGEFLISVLPFDVFESEKLGANKKSVAFRIEFLHPERSLADDEVDRWMTAIVKHLETEHSAQQR
jgi:phenylalanyl-tRNA synthetase beta chain